MGIKKVTIAGGGVLGSQIAYQSAFRGFDVTIWLRSEASIGRCEPKLDRLQGIYVASLEAAKTDKSKWAPGFGKLEEATDEHIDELKAAAVAARTNLHLTTDWDDAFSDADLVIEAVAEDPQQKIAFYEELQKHLPEKTIVVTNSSTLLPSTFAEKTGRPEKFLGYHFANNIWIGNTAEIMPHPGTSDDVYQQLVQYSQDIAMVPIQLHKEQPGYVLNSMLVPLLSAAQMLWAKDVASPQDIDRVWEIATGAAHGPFRIIDVVGLTTVLNIAKMQVTTDDPNDIHNILIKKIEAMIAEGKTGINAGEGFYSYK